MLLQVTQLRDGADATPVYSLRTLCRALEYARATAPTYGLTRRVTCDCCSDPLCQTVCQLHAKWVQSNPSPAVALGAAIAGLCADLWQQQPGHP